VSNLRTLVIINAIYFKAAFASPFDEAMTHEAIFRSSNGTEHNVKMMQKTKKFSYKQTEK
jgi:plasminogen activator inhibitor-1